MTVISQASRPKRLSGRQNISVNWSAQETVPSRRTVKVFADIVAHSSAASAAAWRGTLPRSVPSHKLRWASI